MQGINDPDQTCGAVLTGGSIPGLFSSHQLHELATVAGVQRGLLSQQPLSLAGTLQLISTKATQKQMQLLTALEAWSVIPSTRSLNILSYSKVRWWNWKPLHYLIPIVFFPPVWDVCNEAYQWTISMANIDHTVLLSTSICVFLLTCIAGYCLFCMAVVSCWMSWYMKTVTLCHLGTLCDLKHIGSQIFNPELIIPFPSNFTMARNSSLFISFGVKVTYIKRCWLKTYLNLVKY